MDAVHGLRTCAIWKLLVIPPCTPLGPITICCFVSASCAWYLGAGMMLGDDIASTQLKNLVAKGANPYSSRSFTQNVLTYGDSISKQFECTLAIWKNQRFHKLIPVWDSWDLRERPFLSNIIWIRHLELPSSLYLKISSALSSSQPRS